MSIDYSAFRSALLFWVRSTGLSAEQVIFADQAIPKPELRPYVTIKITLDRAPFFHDESDNFTTLERTRESMHELFVSLQVIGSVTEAGQSLHMQKASQIQSALDRTAVKEQFAIACASAIDDGEILDATQYLETEFEPKAVLDTRWYVGGKDVELLTPSTTGTYIERVTIENNGEVEVIPPL